MSLQIANPEIVNLLVEEQMDRFANEKAKLLEQRLRVIKQVESLWEAQQVICEQLVHDELEEDVETMLESMSKVFEAPVPVYHLQSRLYGPFRYSAEAFEKLDSIEFEVDFMSGEGEDDAEHFDVDEDDRDERPLEVFMNGYSVVMECPLDIGVKAGVLEGIKEMDAIDKRVHDINRQVDDREALSRKLLAQLTAKTLQNNPEQVALIKQALSGFENSQLCIGRDEPTTE